MKDADPQILKLSEGCPLDAWTRATGPVPLASHQFRGSNADLLAQLAGNCKNLQTNLHHPKKIFKRHLHDKTGKRYLERTSPTTPSRLPFLRSHFSQQNGIIGIAL